MSRSQYLSCSMASAPCFFPKPRQVVQVSHSIARTRTGTAHSHLRPLDP